MSHEAEGTELLPFSNSIPLTPSELQRSLPSGDESLNTNAHYADKDVSQSSPKHSPSTRFRRWAVKWWLWELLACLLSLLALVAIILFLQYYDGRAQPDWPSYITLNSVLSWFAVLVQSSMILSVAACISQAKWAHFSIEKHPLKDFLSYDSASQGPLGSVELLSTFRIRSTAGIGAVLTILAIGIGPTVQQMITIQSRFTDSPQAASVGRAQSFLQSGQAETVFEQSLPTTEMIGAIYSGMFFSPGGGITLDMAPSCSSGNCTFSPFQSLATCSTCEDVTHLLTRTCHQAKIEEDLGEPNSTKNVTLYCNYALPNSLNVNVTGEEELSGAFVSSGYLPYIGQTKYGNSFLNFSRIRGPIFDVEGKKLSDPTAMQCSLNWCINTYQARVRDGEIHENTTSTWYTDTTDWISGRTMNSEHIQLRPPTDPSAQHLTNPNFTVGYLASLGLTAWLGEKTTLSNSYAAMVDDQGAEEWGPDDSVNGTSGSDDMIRVFRDSDMNTLFPNIAKSITRNIRSVNASQQTTTDSTEGYLANVTGAGPANGTTHTLEVYVSVRWPWITFSAVLVFTAIVLLGMTAFETARHDVALWKASPLPLLLHGLGDEKTAGFGGAKQLVEMEDLADGIRMRLKDGNGGWALSRLR